MRVLDFDLGEADLLFEAATQPLKEKYMDSSIAAPVVPAVEVEESLPGKKSRKQKRRSGASIHRAECRDTMRPDARLPR